MENGRKASLNDQDEEDDNDDSFSTDTVTVDGTNTVNSRNCTSSCTKSVRVNKPSCHFVVTTATQSNNINKEELYPRNLERDSSSRERKIGNTRVKSEGGGGVTTYIFLIPRENQRRAQSRAGFLTNYQPKSGANHICYKSANQSRGVVEWRSLEFIVYFIGTNLLVFYWLLRLFTALFTVIFRI